MTFSALCWGLNSKLDHDNLESILSCGKPHILRLNTWAFNASPSSSYRHTFSRLKPQFFVTIDVIFRGISNSDHPLWLHTHSSGKQTQTVVTWAKAAINNCPPALFGDIERSPATSTFLTYLLSVHKYPGSLVPYALPVNLSKSWTEITLIASLLTQHNKRHYNRPPCPASSVKANLSSSRMFSQSWFWWTLYKRPVTEAEAAVTWFCLGTTFNFFLHNLERRKCCHVPEALSQRE